MAKYITSDILKKEYENGKLLSLHAQNLWWRNISATPRPNFTHCLPIGFENRQHRKGSEISQINGYALQNNVINRMTRTREDKDKLPLLLVAFYPKSYAPDRMKSLMAIEAIPRNGQSKRLNPFYNETNLSHEEWLRAITDHKFVLAPFGNGLDTHRVAEILLMGGVPVMRKSSISSCYDDSDNKSKDGKIRGSLPVVILNSWTELTKDRLDAEWKRISMINDTHWDYKRLFIDHWLDRIGKSMI
mmetsp:Transcript_24222/g.23279  ORF Transcript_24222/g.23279 Transcript_24222/m.23279 type:complete len:245 (+) Transcript_24222:839-1573(+)